jgi:hypothetical protein
MDVAPCGLAQRKAGQCRSPVTALHNHGKYGGCLLFGEKISNWFSSGGVLDTSMLLLAAFFYAQNQHINVLALPWPVPLFWDAL